MSVNSNYSSSHVASNFVEICIILVIRYGRYSLKLFLILREDNLNSMKVISVQMPFKRHVETARQLDFAG